MCYLPPFPKYANFCVSFSSYRTWGSLFRPVRFVFQILASIIFSSHDENIFYCRIGNLIGAGNAVRAGIAAKISLWMTLIIAAAIRSLLSISSINSRVLTSRSRRYSTVYMVFRKSWARLFNDDEEVIILVAQVMAVLSLFQVHSSSRSSYTRANFLVFL